MSCQIVLVGYMGCGKTTVAKHLAKKMSIEHVDLDSEIEKSEKMSISELFKKHSEIIFRTIEKNKLLETLDQKTNCVISIGGGTPCYYDNMKKICSTTKNVFYLKTSNKTLAKRLFFDRNKRPLICKIKTIEKMLEFVAKHVFERSGFYEMAHHKIITNNKGFDQISNEIFSNIINR